MRWGDRRVWRQLKNLITTYCGGASLHISNFLHVYLAATDSLCTKKQDQWPKPKWNKKTTTTNDKQSFFKNKVSTYNTGPN